MQEIHTGTFRRGWQNPFWSFLAGRIHRNRHVSVHGVGQHLNLEAKEIKVICEYITTFLTTCLSLPYPINPSNAQWRQTSTAASPATAKALLRVQVLWWRLLLQIRQDRSLYPSLLSYTWRPKLLLACLWEALWALSDQKFCPRPSDTFLTIIVFLSKQFFPWLR